MKIQLKTKRLFLAIIALPFLFTACSKGKADQAVRPASVLNTKNKTIAGTGIGYGSTIFDLRDTRDRVVPFDYYGTGISRQLIVYRPGNGMVWMYDNTAPAGSTPVFTRIFASNGGLGSSTGNYDFRDSRDRIIPFDLDGTGKLNYLICYRPGAKLFYIFKNTNGVFTAVLKSGAGVGSGDNYDLAESIDKIEPFDFYNTGHATELICYRGGKGMLWVMKNMAPVGSTPNFVPVYKTGSGIGLTGGSKFDLLDSRDLIQPWIKNPSSGLPTLIAYRPGTGNVWTIQCHADSPTEPFEVINANNTGLWAGDFSVNYDLKYGTDRLTPFDYFGSGNPSTVVCYRPESGNCYMFSDYMYTGTPVYVEGVKGVGSGSTYYDLRDKDDKIFAYDLNGTGKIDHLVCYRPGSGLFWIFKNSNNTMVKIY